MIYSHCLGLRICWFDFGNLQIVTTHFFWKTTKKNMLHRPASPYCMGFWNITGFSKMRITWRAKLRFLCFVIWLSQITHVPWNCASCQQVPSASSFEHWPVGPVLVEIGDSTKKTTSIPYAPWNWNIYLHWHSRWWNFNHFLYIFTPKLRDMIQFDDHILQMGRWKTTN